jgi:chloramphenicol-sensitive protein RarD
MSQGLLATLGAFFIWGLFPLYWKQLEQVPALQIMAHRLVWCFVLVALYLTLSRGLGWWRAAAARPGVLPLLGLSSVLIGANWFLYIWAVNAGHIVETSLGYFINPLVNVLLGVVVLKERLRGLQWVAVVLAAAGVVYLTWRFGRLPWIAFLLALSFGTYGLIRKVADVESLPGLGVESGLLVVPGAVFLIWCAYAGVGGFGSHGTEIDLLLIGGGAVTAIPLLLFAYGARRINYSTVGIVQYLAPTLQLLCGVLVYGEAFTRDHAIGFACIWMALLLYAADGVYRTRRREPARPA